MVILSNPGTPQEVEDEHYAGKVGGDLADSAWAFTEAVLERKVAPHMGAGRSATHDTLMKHLTVDVFGCEIGKVPDRTVITNAVRCSTPENFGKYPPEVRSTIGRECAGRHLVAEVAYWQPRFIVACGAPVKELLQDLRRQGIVSFAFFTTHHPSALGNFIGERKRQFMAVGEMMALPRFRRHSG